MKSLAPMSVVLASVLAFGPVARAEPSHEILPAAQLKASKDSLYVLDGALRNTEGREVRLAQFAGKPVLIAMFYATCPRACPMLISDLKRMESELDEKTRKDLRVVLVSFDPARDTPENLSKLRALHKVDPARWSMLSTDKDMVEELAAVLGIRYRFTVDGHVNHSTVITLLDRQGAIVDRIEGLRQPSQGLLEKLRKL